MSGLGCMATAMHGLPLQRAVTDMQVMHQKPGTSRQCSDDQSNLHLHLSLFHQKAFLFLSRRLACHSHKLTTARQWQTAARSVSAQRQVTTRVVGRGTRLTCTDQEGVCEHEKLYHLYGRIYRVRCKFCLSEGTMVWYSKADER